MAGTAEALRVVFEKLDQLAHQYGPSALDTAVQVTQIDAINSLSGIPGWGLLLGVGIWAVRKAAKKATADDTDGEEAGWWLIGGVIVGIASIIFAVAFLCAVLDVWAWVGLFNPRLALAHEVLSALTSKAPS